jgi:hypothetical protein
MSFAVISDSGRVEGKDTQLHDFIQQLPFVPSKECPDRFLRMLHYDHSRSILVYRVIDKSTGKDLKFQWSDEDELCLSVHNHIKPEMSIVRAAELMHDYGIFDMCSIGRDTFQDIWLENGPNNAQFKYFVERTSHVLDKDKTWEFEWTPDHSALVEAPSAWDIRMINVLHTTASFKIYQYMFPQRDPRVTRIQYKQGEHLVLTWCLKKKNVA